MSCMDRSVCFGEADKSYTELLEEMPREFEKLGQEIKENELRKTWAYVASSERLIVDMLPSAEGLNDHLSQLTDQVGAAESEYSKARRRERNAIVRLNNAKAALMASVSKELPGIPEGKSEKERVINLLLLYREKLTRAKESLLARRQILERI